MGRCSKNDALPALQINDFCNEGTMAAMAINHQTFESERERAMDI